MYVLSQLSIKTSNRNKMSIYLRNLVFFMKQENEKYPQYACGNADINS